MSGSPMEGTNKHLWHLTLMIEVKIKAAVGSYNEILLACGKKK